MGLGAVAFYLAMLFSSDVWAVYGVGLAGRDALELNQDCTHCIVYTPTTISTSTSTFLAPQQQQVPPFETPLSATWHGRASLTPAPTSVHTSSSSPMETAVIPTHPPNNILYASPSSSSYNTNANTTAPSNPFSNLSTPTRAAIITGISIISLAIILTLLEICFLRGKRRERALRRAIEEVERGGGLEMSKSVGWVEESASIGSGSGSENESKENMVVLESRVEISIVEDEGEESEGNWDGVWDDEDGEWERGKGRGRMAMSLPRREY